MVLSTSWNQDKTFAHFVIANVGNAGFVKGDAQWVDLFRWFKHKLSEVSKT